MAIFDNVSFIDFKFYDFIPMAMFKSFCASN